MESSILRLPDVINKTKLSRSVIYALISEGKFPRQIKLTKRSSGWILSELEQWLAERVAERDGAVEK